MRVKRRGRKGQWERKDGKKGRREEGKKGEEEK